MSGPNLDHKHHKKISGNPALKLSSIKIHEALLEKFKIESVRSKLSLQSLLNRSINLYLNDVEFRNKINTHTDLLASGSL